MKCYQVTNKPVAKTIADTVKEETLADAELGAHPHKLFLANLPFDATKGEIVDFLESEFHVLQLELPPNRNFPNTNRGFAFVTIISNAPTEHIIQKLDGLDWRGRRLHCAQTRDDAFHKV